MKNIFKDLKRRDHKRYLGGLDVFKYIGPGLLVTVGFIDPGNWASNFAAGSEFGYSLLWVVTLSTIMLIVLQHNVAHLGIVTGLCLSEAATKYTPSWVSRPILGTAVLASISTSLAEILGGAIALQMLFDIPIIWGSVLTTVFVVVMLFTNSYKKIERSIIAFVSVIGLSFIYELFLVKIDWSLAAQGWVTPSFPHGSMRYERLSTDRSDCRLSYAAPVGVMLPCDHIYNQWIFIDDSSENLARFEKTAKNMQSLSRYSRSNQINKEWLDEYLNVAHTNGLQSVRCHCNVIAWAENGDELRRVKNDVGSALALMECTPHHNTTDLPAVYWAGIPGNEADFPSEESFYTFTEQALCFFTAETCYRNSLSPFGLRMVDRLTGKPVFLDISDLPMKKGVVTNRNKFILGPSGSGKSFFTNHMVRQYWEQGTHILLVDTGNSYKGLCDLIRRKTNGDDGVYFTYQENDPISFNPFFTEDYRYDIEKRDSIKTLILTLWKREDEPPRRSEEVALSNAVSLYIEKIKKNRKIKPNFNSFYDFVRKDYRKVLADKNVREKDFDVDGFLNVLEPYYKNGEYGYLLNSDKELDLLNKRFIVFELDVVKDNPVLFPVVTIIIMETFINKMRRLQGIRKMILIEEA